MKTVIVHDSRYGNGARVADAFRDVWEEAGDEVVVAHVSQYDPARLVGDAPDLVVVGAAVRMFSVSRASKRWMSRAARELRVRGTRGSWGFTVSKSSSQKGGVLEADIPHF